MTFDAAYVHLPVMPCDSALSCLDTITLKCVITYCPRQLAHDATLGARSVEQGVEEPDIDKLSPLLKLRHRNATTNALSELGGTTQIRQVFFGFQRYLYQG